MDGLVAVGVPLALAIRLVSVVATLMLVRHARVPMGGARRLHRGFVVTAAVAVRRWVSGSSSSTMARSSPCGVRDSAQYSVTPLSAWFLMTLSLIAVPRRALQWGFRPRSRPARMAAVGAAFNAMVGGLEVVFVADGVIAFLCGWKS